MAVNIQPSDDPEFDRRLLARIEEGRRLYPDDDVMDWDDFLISIGEDPDE